MSDIIVKNSCVVLKDYTLNSCKPLENFFKIYDPITHQYFYKGLFYDNENKILYLPRGIDIWYIENLLQQKAKILKDSYNKFDIYDNIRMKLKPKNEDQRKALKFMLGKEEYLETTTKSQLSINLNTGKGKTYISVATIAISGIKSIIITYSKDVLLQWKKCILEYTNITNREIFEIDGSGSIFNLLHKNTQDIYKYKIFLVSHSTLKSFGDTYGWDQISILFKHIKVGLKFFDEAHQNFDNMCMIDFYTNVYKTYYLTATPGRSDPDENRIYQTAFKNILSIDLFRKEQDPHTKYIAIRFNSKPQPYDISNCKGKYGLDRNKYTNHIINNENFLKCAAIVIDLALKMAKSNNDKILIYIGTNNAILQFYQWIIQNFPELNGKIGIFSSIVNDDDKKISLQKKVILTTTKSAGAAIDIKGLKVTIVLAEPFKSEILARQTLGRTRDNNTFYIEIVDKGFYYCNKYFLLKKKIFEIYAQDTELIDLSDVELENYYNKIIKKGIVNCKTEDRSLMIQEKNVIINNDKLAETKNGSPYTPDQKHIKPFCIINDNIIKPFEFL